VDAGRTSLDLLRDQLAVLRSGVETMHEAALASDGDRLLANGYFLEQRFGRSALDSGPDPDPADG